MHPIAILVLPSHHQKWKCNWPFFVRTGPIYSLGTFASSFGAFSVAVRLTHEQRIRTVLLSCLENVTSSQTVWRTILDAIIEQDLESMTTFVWGRVALKRDEFSDLDQMVVGYTNDPGVVRPDDETSPSLQARKLSPKSLGAGDSHLKDLLRKSRNPKPNEKQ